MINVNDFKTGMTIKIEGNIYTVLEFQHVKPGKGAAFVRTKLKNLRTGATIEYTFNSGVKCETARIERKPMQYLYNTGDEFTFMNMEDYSQVELNKSIIGDNIKFFDAEDPDEGEDPNMCWYLNADTLSRGCALYSENRGDLVECLRNADFDADEADCLMQYALIGEIVFG